MMMDDSSDELYSEVSTAASTFDQHHDGGGGHPPFSDLMTSSPRRNPNTHHSTRCNLRRVVIDMPPSDCPRQDLCSARSLRYPRSSHAHTHGDGPSCRTAPVACAQHHRSEPGGAPYRLQRGGGSGEAHAHTQRDVLLSLRSFLRSEGWRFRWVESEPDGHIHITSWVSCGRLKSQQILIFYEHGVISLVFPNLMTVDVSDTHRLDAMCQLLMHLNRRTIFGTFSLDLADGEVVYKNVLEIQNGKMSRGQIQHFLSASLCIAGTLSPPQE